MNLVYMKGIQCRLSVLFLFCTVVFAANSPAAGPTVLFDQAHNQQFLVERDGALDLSRLAGLFVEQGCQVRTTDIPFSKTGLTGVDILVISGAFAAISEDEVTVIMDFLRQGGKLSVMTHIPIPFLSIFKELGVSVSTGVVREQKNIIGKNSNNFLVRDLSLHPLTSGLDTFSIYGSWALLARNENLHSIARTSSGAWVDLNRNGVLNERDAMQSFSVVLTGRVGQGSFVVFADDAMFQNRFLKDENLTLAKNLVTWFCGPGKANVHVTIQLHSI